jgi:5-amino-6-(5-phosphoribosylamino)uracil reductase
VTALGPGSAFELLLEENDKDTTAHKISLTDEFRQIYRGDWMIPKDSQYRYSNFVISHDGKTSFSVHGHEGGGDISGFNKHDQWFMGLARARADAVMVGANTLRSEPEHKWTAEFIFPSDSAAFQRLRENEGRSKFPLQVMVTRSGDINPDAAIFSDSSLEVIIATTEKSAARINSLNLSNAKTLVVGESDVDLRALNSTLLSDYSVKTMLCEGGPKFYGSMIVERQIDEEFLTMSPVMVGASSNNYRPGLVDGIALEPGNNFGGTLKSVRRAGNMLFLRTRFSR